MLVVFLIASIALVVLAGATEGSFLPLAKAECAKKTEAKGFKWLKY